MVLITPGLIQKLIHDRTVFLHSDDDAGLGECFFQGVAIIARPSKGRVFLGTIPENEREVVLSRFSTMGFPSDRLQGRQWLASYWLSPYG